MPAQSRKPTQPAPHAQHIETRETLTPFAVRLRTLRADKGLTQAQLAAELGVSAAYLSALEHGKRGAPPFAFVQKVVQYFGLIWDEAEDLVALARLSRPKVVIDTSGLSPKAVQLVNILSERITRLDDETLSALLTVLGSRDQ